MAVPKEPHLAKSLEQLRGMPDDEIVAAHDSFIERPYGISVGISYYLDELQRRSLEKSAKSANRVAAISVAVAALSLVVAVIALFVDRG